MLVILFHIPWLSDFFNKKRIRIKTAARRSSQKSKRRRTMGRGLSFHSKSATPSDLVYTEVATCEFLLTFSPPNPIYSHHCRCMSRCPVQLPDKRRSTQSSLTWETSGGGTPWLSGIETWKLCFAAQGSANSARHSSQPDPGAPLPSPLPRATAALSVSASHLLPPPPVGCNIAGHRVLQEY